MQKTRIGNRFRILQLTWWLHAVDFSVTSVVLGETTREPCLNISATYWITAACCYVSDESYWITAACYYVSDESYWITAACYYVSDESYWITAACYYVSDESSGLLQDHVMHVIIYKI